MGEAAVKAPANYSPAARALWRIMDADRRAAERIPSIGKKCRVIAAPENQTYYAPVGMLVQVAASDADTATVYEYKRTPIPEHERTYYTQPKHTLRVIPQN